MLSYTFTWFVRLIAQQIAHNVKRDKTVHCTIWPEQWVSKTALNVSCRCLFVFRNVRHEQSQQNLDSQSPLVPVFLPHLSQKEKLVKETKQMGGGMCKCCRSDKPDFVVVPGAARNGMIGEMARNRFLMSRTRLVKGNQKNGFWNIWMTSVPSLTLN